MKFIHALVKAEVCVLHCKPVLLLLFFGELFAPIVVVVEVFGVAPKLLLCICALQDLAHLEFIVAARVRVDRVDVTRLDRLSLG